MPDIRIHRLIRSRRRSIALIVTPEATLTVRAPLHTPLTFIEDLVLRKADWIRRRIKAVRNAPRALPWNFAEGERLLVLGQRYRLRYFDGDRITLTDEIMFPRAFLARGEEELTFWYRQKGLALVQELVNRHAGVMGVRPSAVRLSRATRRWASCGASGALHFNWRLIMAPLSVVDYVVVHELAHLLVRDHSARFWSKVREHCPDHRSSRAWLREHQALIIPE